MIPIKSIPIAFILAALAAPVFAAEDDTFSGNIAVMTDYNFRGISQTRQYPAIQGEIEYNHPSGFTFGVWGSNIDFGVEGEGSLELNIYGSYAMELSPATELEIGLIGYAYPGTASELHYDYLEFFTAGSYKADPVTWTASLYYSPDMSGHAGDAYYPEIGVAVDLPHNFIVDAAFGRQWTKDNIAYEYPDYNTWNLGVAYRWNDFTAKLQYVDTDIPETDCDTDCGPTAILSVTKEF